MTNRHAYVDGPALLKKLGLPAGATSTDADRRIQQLAAFERYMLTATASTTHSQALASLAELQRRRKAAAHEDYRVHAAAEEARRMLDRNGRNQQRRTSCK